MKWLFGNFLSEFKQIWVIFNHLRLWIALAKHNFKLYALSQQDKGLNANGEDNRLSFVLLDDQIIFNGNKISV